ncbi:MAG: sensor histidine kinase [Acidimicrobiales bacterium]
MTTAVLTALYVLAAGALDVVVASRLTHQVDQRLTDLAARATSVPTPGHEAAHLSQSGDFDDAPVLLWSADPSGKTKLLSARGPALPERDWPTIPTTASFGGGQFRVLAKPLPRGGRLVAGESLGALNHLRSLLLVVEASVAPFIVAATFLLSLLIGLKASAPVEKARRRQLELAADASHELRTPLSVIEAEVGLALGAHRPAAYYRSSLERVAFEGRRLRRIIDDLLWLARFDSTPSPPTAEPLDLGAAAVSSVQRFAAVATTGTIELSATNRGSSPALVKVAPEWIERVLGVLVDNALRYSPQGGTVSVTVAAEEARVRLVVEDDGPGIPEAERERLFDRFHRATAEPGGAGLGLAIADAVVSSSDGRWAIGASASGGTRMEVSWPRVRLGARARSASKARSEGGKEGPETAEQHSASCRADDHRGDKQAATQVGTYDATGAAGPVGKPEDDRVAQGPEDMDGHGGKQGDKADLVDQPTRGMPTGPGPWQGDAAGDQDGGGDHHDRPEHAQ